MTKQEIWVTLKNEQSISCRPIRLGDVTARHEFFVVLSLAQTGMVHTEQEIEFHAYETHDKIVDFLKNKRGFWLVALDGEKIIGEIDITIKNLIRIRHNGALTVGILPEYQGMGLGTLLMEQALIWARQHKITRLELSVFASNRKAQNLYIKFGFVLEGIRKNFLRHEDGSLEDDIIMAKHI